VAVGSDRAIKRSALVCASFAVATLSVAVRKDWVLFRSVLALTVITAGDLVLDLPTAQRWWMPAHIVGIVSAAAMLIVEGLHHSYLSMTMWLALTGFLSWRAVLSGRCQNG